MKSTNIKETVLWISLLCCVVLIFAACFPSSAATIEAFIWMHFIHIHTWGLTNTTSVCCDTPPPHTHTGCWRSVSGYWGYDQCGSGLSDEQAELQAVNRIIESLDALQMLLLCWFRSVFSLVPSLVKDMSSVLPSPVSFRVWSLLAVSLPPLRCLFAFTLSTHLVKGIHFQQALKCRQCFTSIVCVGGCVHTFVSVFRQCGPEVWAARGQFMQVCMDEQITTFTQQKSMH